MDVYAGSDLPHARSELIRRLTLRQVGILPTDTLYGLSGDASVPAVVRRIQRLKRRRRPPSVIPPSVRWAADAVDESLRAKFRAIEPRFRGRFTTLWPAAPGPLRRVLGSDFVGLRFPHHWITDLAEALGAPLVTTSVNRTTHPPMRDLESLDPAIAQGVDFIVYEGPLAGPASTLVWCEGRTPRLERRA